MADMQRLKFKTKTNIITSEGLKYKGYTVGVVVSLVFFPIFAYMVLQNGFWISLTVSISTSI